MTTHLSDLDEVVLLAGLATPDVWINDGPHLFTDTRVQVCCGRGYQECCGSPDIDGDVREIGSTKGDVDAQAIAAAVNYIRQHHAAIRRDAEDARTERAIQSAAERLPFGYTLSVCVEKDAGWVELSDPYGDDVPVEVDTQSMATRIQHAIDVAIAKVSGNG